jgi:phenylacetate-CoA ligase
MRFAKGGMRALRITADLIAMSRAQWARRERLEAMQARRLRAVVTHAHATVPLYHERLNVAGIVPAQVRSLADLAHLPVLTRAELEAADPAQKISSLYPLEVLKEARTSGSSGRPLTIRRDAYDHRLRKALFVRALHAAGFRLGQRMLLLAQLPPHPPPGWLRWHYAGRDTAPEIHLAAWRELRPKAVYGMATPLRRLAELLVQERSPRHRSAMVFSTGETLDGPSRRLLEQGYGAPVFDLYGSCETGTAGYECREHAGLHMAEDTLLTELLPVPGSDAGRVVLTSLTSYGMPLIRYEIGDLAVAGPSERCACGRTFRRLSRIQGRLIDCLRLPDASLVSPYAIEMILERIPGVSRFQVIQQRLDAVEVRLQARAEAGLAEAVRLALAPLLGPAMKMEINLAADLDPPPGQKFRLVQGLAAQGPPVDG